MEERGFCGPGSLVPGIHEPSKNTSPAPSHLPYTTPHLCLTWAVLPLTDAQEVGPRGLPTHTFSLSPDSLLPYILSALGPAEAGSNPESGPVPAFVPLSALGSMAPHASTSGLASLAPAAGPRLSP